MDKIKIGCLHGYGTNKKFLQRQMRSFKKELNREVEFIYLESKIIAPKPYILDEKVLQLLEGEPKSWTPFRSYHHSYEEYVSQFLDNLKIVIQQGSSHYDGLLGFSQGATMLHALLKFRQAGKVQWKCLENLKFSLIVCGTHWVWKDVDLQKQLNIPSLHLVSSVDFLFRKSLFLTLEFKDPIVIYHPFGHSFPRLGREEAQKILQFIRKSIKDSSKIKYENSKL